MNKGALDVRQFSKKRTAVFSPVSSICLPSCCASAQCVNENLGEPNLKRLVRNISEPRRANFVWQVGTGSFQVVL